MASKIHFRGKNALPVCGRNAVWSATEVNRVTCLNCKKQQEFIDAQTEALATEAEAFLAQEPRVVKEPWKDGNITCRNCLGDLFREANRTCHGHYLNFVCANCGETTERLSETGMSF